MMYLKLQNPKNLLGPQKPGKQWKNAGLYIYSELHNTHQIQFTGGFNANKSHKDLTSRLIVFCFIYTFGFGVPLMKNPFHGKNNVAQLDYQESSRMPNKPPKSQQTPRGWTPQKETWTILGKYHGIQVSGFGKTS